ncbi:hypothetical protein [Ilumatobacter sp.]|uniref:hypothetical protein n=1 Tax=Ilumatobacter sp. TaxID=1967498 RepID=UPI003B524551
MTAPPSADELADVRRACDLAAAAQRRLLDRLDELVAAGRFDAGSPSRRTGSARGGLVAHLARQADAHRGALDAAADRRGIVEAGRRGGRPDLGRDGGLDGFDAQAGAPTPGHAVGDLRRACAALESAWERTDWVGRTTSGSTALVALGHLRLREVSLVSVDLDVGIELGDLDPTYVRLELRRLQMVRGARRPIGLGADPLPAAVAARPPAERLGWLTGRLSIEGVDDVDPL